MRDRLSRSFPGYFGAVGQACILLFLLALTGCAAAVPAVDADILSAAQRASDADVLHLLLQQGERIARKPFLAGNQVELLLNGPATYAAMSAAIRSARRRIDMESYEFETQEGARFADLLLARRAAGVEVNLIYDAGGRIIPTPLCSSVFAGSDFGLPEYNPLLPNGRVPIDINRRDHRKLLIVDGILVITGGVNITRVYDNSAAAPGEHDPDKLPWRDTDVRIRGPVVAQFSALFMETWREQRGPSIPEPPATPGLVRGSALVQAIDGAPGDGRPLIYRPIVAAIMLARKSVHLTTGFFAPTPDLAHVLKDAARRGDDVEIIVPAHSDSSMAIEAGRARYEDLLEAGVNIYERQGVVLHAKTAVIDGVWTTVGS